MKARPPSCGRRSLASSTMDGPRSSRPTATPSSTRALTRRSSSLVALPGGRDALFGGKVSALWLILAIVALIGGLLSLVLLDLPVSLPGHLLILVALGVIALPPVIVVDVVLTLRLRARAALVPILALPVLVPQLVAATRGATAAMSGDGVGALSWAGLLFAFAVVYGVLGLTIVPAAVE